MIDFLLFRGFDDRRTDGRTDERTLVVVELLSRLKIQENPGKHVFKTFFAPSP